MHMQYRAQRYIAKITRSIVITDHAIRKHGERMRVVPEKFAFSLHAYASATVGVVYKDQFTSIAMRVFESRKFSRLGAKRFVGNDRAKRCE